MAVNTPLEVSTLVDELDADYTAGDFSLREALSVADAQAGDDVIQFNASLSGGTITLDNSLGQLVVDSNVDVQGLGADQLTVDAADNSRVFRVGDGITAALGGLTITGGNADFGGGVHTAGQLTVTRSTVTGNTADRYGGGISQTGGSLTLVDSTISDNSIAGKGESLPGSAPSIYGGGIFSAKGVLLIDSSTISGNSSVSALDEEGGRYWAGHGGGIYAYKNTTTITNSTISGNVGDYRGGGIESVESLLVVTNSTITKNDAEHTNNVAGGIYAYVYDTPEAIIHNTIIADNGGADVAGSFAAVSSHNLIGIIGDSTGLDSGTGTLYGTGFSPLDPKLGPLSNNGGPTKTHAMFADSPALDAGSNARAADAGLTQDQRDSVRVVDADGDSTAVVDIGACESLAVTHFPVAVDENYTTDEHTPLTIAAPGLLTNDSDPDGDTLKVIAFDVVETYLDNDEYDQYPADILGWDTDGSLTYDPNGRFVFLGPNGSDTRSANYTVSDGNGGIDTARVTITINGLNDPIVATDDHYSIDKGSVLTISAPGVLGNEEDADTIGDTPNVTNVDTSGMSAGILTVNADGSLTFDPNGEFDYLAPNETATVWAIYTVSDSGGVTDTATVAITITGGGPLVVSIATDEQDGDFSAGDLSLREALVLAE